MRAADLVALDPALRLGRLRQCPVVVEREPQRHTGFSRSVTAADILLPDTLQRPAARHSLPLAVDDHCYPHEYVAAAALESLALRLGEEARPLLEAALDNEQHQIQEATASGIARLAGLRDPVGFVLERENAVGFDGLTRPQRIVYCAWLFDVEVCNGGITQFFGNFSGDHAVETLDALRETCASPGRSGIGFGNGVCRTAHPRAESGMRLAVLDERHDEFDEAFEPLEKEYYRTCGLLRQKTLLYAAQHPEHFRD